MRWGPWVCSLWPGLARLWMRGDWSALLLAIGFSLLLNVALISTFVWPEWIGAGFNTVVWPVLAAVWAICCWSTWQQREELFVPPAGIPGTPAKTDSASYDRLYIEAQSEYLKGKPAAAEVLLERQLQRYPRDAASRLMLATLLRRTGRWSEAVGQLDELEKLDQALQWRFEILQERRWIAEESAADADEDPSESVAASVPADPGEQSRSVRGAQVPESGPPQRAVQELRKNNPVRPSAKAA